MKEVRSTKLDKKEKSIEDCLNDWLCAVGESKYDVAARICNYVMQECRCGLNGQKTGKNTYVVMGVLFHGLHHAVELFESTSSSEWMSDSETIERVWGLICDAEDRLGFAANLVEFPTQELNESIKRIVLDTLSLRKQINDVYGAGWFVSPEIVVGKTFCSICEQDCRRCEHVSGRIYDGNICQPVVNDVDEVGDTALVRHPEDLRCRIWPWMRTVSEDGGTVFKGVPILHSFEIDAFRNSDSNNGVGLDSIQEIAK